MIHSRHWLLSCVQLDFSRIAWHWEDDECSSFAQKLFMLFWLYCRILALDQPNCKIAPACISDYCTTTSRPGTNEKSDSSLPPNTSSKKRICHITNVQKGSSIRKRWKYVINGLTAQEVVDTAPCKKLKYFQACDEGFPKMEQQLLVNASRAQGRPQLLSMLGSSGPLWFDFHWSVTIH